MRYSGGKSRIAKRLSEVMLPIAKAEGLDTYIEPFVGGGAMGAVMGKHFDHAHYSDVHEDLILMWQALHRGDEFPDEVSEDEYQALKNAEPSAFRGLVGFGASFGGKWFGGYARGNSVNYLGQSLRSATRGIEGMRGKKRLAYFRDPTHQ